MGAFYAGPLSGSYNAAGARREATRLGIPAVGHQYACILFSETLLRSPARLSTRRVLFRKFSESTDGALPLPFRIHTFSGYFPSRTTRPNSTEPFSTRPRRSRPSRACHRGDRDGGNGEITYELSKLSNSFMSAKLTIEPGKLYRGDRIYVYSEPRSPLPDCSYPLPLEKRLSSAIRQGSLIDAKDIISDMKPSLKKWESAAPRRL